MVATSFSESPRWAKWWLRAAGWAYRRDLGPQVYATVRSEKRWHRSRCLGFLIVPEAANP